MTTLLICVIVVYLTIVVFTVSQKGGMSKFPTAVQCHYTWDALFVVAALLIFFTDSVGLWLMLGVLMALFAFAAWLTRNLDPHQSNYSGRFSRALPLLKAEYPLLVIAGLVGWHMWDTYNPTRHPVVQQAQRRQQKIEDARKLMEFSLVNMHHRLDEFEVPVTDDEYSFSDILFMTEGLIDLADDLLREYASLVRHHDELTKQLTDAPDMFRRAGHVWRQYAMEELAVGDAEIAQRYSEVAALWEAYANAVEDGADDPFSLQELQQMMTFVRQARKLLARLQVNAPLRAGAEFLDRKHDLETQLRTFIAEFDALRKAIRGLANQLNDEGGPVDAIDERVGALPKSELAIEDLRSTVPQGIPRMIRDIAASAD